MPGGSKPLQDAEHSFDLLDASAEFFRRRFEIAADIAGFVDQIDQILADHPPRRCVDRQRQLLAQPIGERRLRRHKGLEIVFAVIAAAGADRGPFRIGGRPFGRAWRARLGRIRKHVVGSRIERVFHDAAARLRRVGVPGLAFRRGTVRRIGGACIGRALLVVGGAVEQRIALELRFDVGDQIQIRQLQELDRLHELRRHHQRLALADLESLG